MRAGCRRQGTDVDHDADRNHRVEIFTAGVGPVIGRLHRRQRLHDTRLSARSVGHVASGEARLGLYAEAVAEFHVLVREFDLRFDLITLLLHQFRGALASCLQHSHVSRRTWHAGIASCSCISLFECREAEP